MPALRWFGRRWRTGSDDFHWSSIYGAMASLVTGLFAITRFDPSNDPSSPLTFSVCPGATEVFRTALYAEGIVSFIACGICIILAVASARGRIFDPSKRAAVPIVLYFAALTYLALLILNCIVTHQAITRDEIHLCIETKDTAMLTAILVLNFLTTLAFGLMLLLSFDPTGRRTFESEEEYHSLWVERCSLMCCCYRNHSSGQEAFSEAARTMASLFRAFDIVPSDIAAGMLVLHGYQSHKRHQRRAVTFQNATSFSSSAVVGGADSRRNQYGVEGTAEEQLKSPLSKYVHVPLRPGERLSTQARPVPPLTEEQRTRLNRVHYFSKYYLGAYGWMLYTFMNLVTGIPRLWCADTVMCCRKKRHNGVEFHETCGCDTTALKQVTGLSSSDILLTSFENTIYRPCFYVALDRASNTVVIAVRGTMSLEDCITDMVAAPAEIALDSQPPSEDAATFSERSTSETLQPSDASLPESTSSHHPYHTGHVHSGMLQSANNILQVLVKEGIVHGLIHGAHEGCQVVVLGHSLGAGTAAILSMLLWAKWPSLRPRMHCIAYSPPGGLMSEAAQRHTAPFMTACFVGNDVIPRASQQNFDLLRDNLLAVLAHTSLSKSAVFCYCCCPQKLGAMLPQSLELDARGHFTSAADTPPTEASNFSSSSKELTALRRLGASAVGPQVSSATGSRAGGATTTTPLAVSLTTKPPVLLVPPSIIVQYVKMVNVPKSYCIGSCCQSEIHCPVFIRPEELDHVICHPSMTMDHFPDRVYAVIGETQRALEAGELYRFSGDAAEAQHAHEQYSQKVMTEHSMVFVSSATAAVAIHRQPVTATATMAAGNDSSSSRPRVYQQPSGQYEGSAGFTAVGAAAAAADGGSGPATPIPIQE